MATSTGMSLEQVAHLLGCEEEAFVSHLTYQIVTMNMGRRNSIIKKHLSSDGVTQNMLALNKWLYIVFIADSEKNQFCAFYCGRKVV